MKARASLDSGKDQEKANGKKIRRRARPPLNMAAWSGIAILIFYALVAILGPFFTPHSPAEILTSQAFAPPGEAMLLGGDYFGRDLLSRMLYGAGLTIGLATVATLLGFAIGIGLGFTAAEIGGLGDDAISRLVDIMISLPPILLALVAIIGAGSSLPVLVGTVAVTHATRVARVARAIAMDIATQDFVKVARARGEGLWSILRREILPNSVDPLAAEFGVRLTYSILFLSALSFLGLGIQPPTADWGAMVKENLVGLLYGSWAPILPAAAIGSFTVGVNLVVDWVMGQTGREISEELLK
jgi:peptide/nickel transport system permease protein